MRADPIPSTPQTASAARWSVSLCPLDSPKYPRSYAYGHRLGRAFMAGGRTAMIAAAPGEPKVSPRPQPSRRSTCPLPAIPACSSPTVRSIGASRKRLQGRTTDVSEPGDGEVLLRTLWLSLDPYMRGRMSAVRSYAKPVEIGEVMTGETVSEVVTSRARPAQARRHGAGPRGLAGIRGDARRARSSGSIPRACRSRISWACSGCPGRPPIARSWASASRRPARPC